MAHLARAGTGGFLDRTDAAGNQIPHSPAFEAVSNSMPAINGAIVGAVLGWWLISRKTVSLPVGLSFAPLAAVLVPAGMKWFGSLNDAPVKVSGYHMFGGTR